jgi:hypothetical protein
MPSPLVALLAPKIFDIIGKFVPDKDEANRLANEIATLAERNAHEINLGQIGVNQVEAAHKSLFVAGWRPFIGWVCGLGLAFNSIGYPLLEIWYEMPDVNVELLYPVMMGMLGMGALRSYEKRNGVAREI